MKRNVEKKEKKIKRTVFKNRKFILVNLLLVAVIFFSVFIMLFTGKTQAASPDTFVGNAFSLPTDVFDGQFFYPGVMHQSNTGHIVYCMNHGKTHVIDLTMHKIETPETNPGITYILQNGFPNARWFASDTDNYAVTQWALWIYLYEINLVDPVDRVETEKDMNAMMNSYGVYSAKINELLAGARSATDATVNTPSTLSFSANSTNLTLSSDGKYYQTSTLTVQGSSNLQHYRIEVSGISDYEVRSGGRTIDISNTTLSNGETFQVFIPVSSVLNNRDFSFNVRTIGTYLRYETFRYYTTQQAEPGKEAQDIAYYDTNISENENLAQQKTFSIPSGNIEVIKLDSDTNQPIAGAKLRLRTSSGTTIEEWTSTTSSKVFNNLPAGMNYVVEEISAPSGYAKASSTTQTVALTSSGATVRFENPPIKVQISKTDVTTGEELVGTTLQIENEDGEVILLNGETLQWVTDGSIHLIERLPVGTYYLREVRATDGYILNEDPIRFVVEETGEIQTVSMTNDYTKLSILKRDITTDQGLPGATLQIENGAGDVVVLNGEELRWVTSTTPYEIDRLPVGTYYLREVEAPDGYVLNETRVKFDVQETTEVQSITMDNDVTKLRVRKIDLGTGRYIAGSVLRIINQDTGEVYLDNLETNAENAIEITKIPLGNYVLQEMSAPDGYVLNETPVSFEVENTADWQTVTMTNDFTKVLIHKLDLVTGEELAGATLQIENEIGEIIELNGEYLKWETENVPHEIDRLPEGIYYLREVAVPPGYVLNEEPIRFEVTATAQMHVVTMENDYTRVRISKRDITTDEELVGATLQIEDSEGNIVQLNGEELKWVSGEEPYEMEKLPVGTYYLREVEAPVGYILNQEPMEFVVQNTGEVQTFTMDDDVTKIQVGKLDLGTGEYIAGAVLRIIDQATGEVYLDNIVTTDEPTLITKIPVGTYVLQEVSAPSGYVLNPTSLLFTVSSAGGVEQVFIKNNYTYVRVIDQKIHIDLSIPGFEIEIKNSQGEVVDSYTTDGKTHVTEELEVGRYTIEEISAPAGYVCYPTPIDVYVPGKGTSEENEIAFPNDYTKVQISKVDIETDEVLSGATLELRNEEGEVIDQWVSEALPHEIERLAVGTYVLVETSAPDGYVLQENPLKVEVQETGEVQIVTMSNEKKVEVVDTSSQASVITYLCGGAITLSGIGLVLYNVKEHKKRKKKI